MSDKEDIYESDEYDYKYRYMNCITMYSKYILIADGKCPLDGDEHLTKFDWKTGDTGDFDIDYHMSGPIRDKEEWYCFLKYKEDVENNITMLDLILINSKLYEALPERGDFDRLEDLNWEGDGEVTISNNILTAFDCKYFNNLAKYKIPDNVKEMPHPWFEFISRAIMKQKHSIIVNQHGAALFLDNGEYAIYSIKDDTNEDVLGLDIELYDPKTLDSSDEIHATIATVAAASAATTINSKVVKTY